MNIERKKAGQVEQREEVEEGGNKGYVSLSSIATKESWLQYLDIGKKALVRTA